MPNTAWPKAVIFDLDGTLIDSVPDIAGTLNTVLEAEFKVPALPQNDVRVMIGNGVAKLIERGLKAHDLPHDKTAVDTLFPGFIKIYLARAAQDTYVYEGGTELLETLAKQGTKIGLCTNKTLDVSRLILRDLGIISYFDSIIGGNSGYAPKPDPEPMHACLNELGVTADQAVFIGDSTADVKTARNADMPVILMSYGYTAIPAAELGGDIVIDKLVEVIQAIETLTD